MDVDGTDASRAFAERLLGREEFEAIRAPRADALEAVRRGSRVAAVVLQPGFGEAYGRMFYGPAPEVHVFTDPGRQAERGMLDNVLVITMSEFGRTPRINGHIGRDHWPEAWSVAMSGCGINRGICVGKTNDQGTWVDGDEHDIGHLFHTWFNALGIDPQKVEYNNVGQPLPIAHDDMHAVKELLS